MVCSFGFVSFGCSIDLFSPVDSTPMLLEEQLQNAAAAASLKGKSEFGNQEKTVVCVRIWW